MNENLNESLITKENPIPNENLIFWMRIWSGMRLQMIQNENLITNENPIMNKNRESKWESNHKQESNYY